MALLKKYPEANTVFLSSFYITFYSDVQLILFSQTRKYSLDDLTAVDSTVKLLNQREINENTFIGK